MYSHKKENREDRALVVILANFKSFMLLKFSVQPLKNRNTKYIFQINRGE